MQVYLLPYRIGPEGPVYTLAKKNFVRHREQGGPADPTFPPPANAGNWVIAGGRAHEDDRYAAALREFREETTIAYNLDEHEHFEVGDGKHFMILAVEDPHAERRMEEINKAIGEQRPPDDELALVHGLDVHTALRCLEHTEFHPSIKADAEHWQHLGKQIGHLKQDIADLDQLILGDQQRLSQYSDAVRESIIASQIPPNHRLMKLKNDFRNYSAMLGQRQQITDQMSRLGQERGQLYARLKKNPMFRAQTKPRDWYIDGLKEIHGKVLERSASRLAGQAHAAPPPMAVPTPVQAAPIARTASVQAPFGGRGGRTAHPAPPAPSPVASGSRPRITPMPPRAGQAAPAAAPAQAMASGSTPGQGSGGAGLTSGRAQSGVPKKMTR